MKASWLEGGWVESLGCRFGGGGGLRGALGTEVGMAVQPKRAGLFRVHDIAPLDFLCFYHNFKKGRKAYLTGENKKDFSTCKF